MKFADSHSEKLHSWRHCQLDVNEKWITTLQHEKVRTRRVLVVPQASAGATKDGPTHKNCDENTSSRPSKKSEVGMAGKSASNEGSELLKFGSILTASITALNDTMAGKFDQLEDILTRPDIWAQDTEERDDASVDDTDNDSTGIYRYKRCLLFSTYRP